MPHWTDSIERQIIMALAQCKVESGHFDPDGAGQLWAWQGKRRISIKETLGLELPGVYTSPPAQLIRGSDDNPSQGQTWQIETQHNNLMEVVLRTASPTSVHGTGYIIRIFDKLSREACETFCNEMSEIGQTGIALGLRGAESTEKLMDLAEVYLGLGRCYGEATTIDLMRIVDHLEGEFGVEGEPIILVLSGYAIPLGLAYAAIDQRVSGLVIDYSDSPKGLNEPMGVPPFFLASYSSLGPNPGLVTMQCCAPRPMAVIGRPKNVNESWIRDPHAGVLSFAAQLDILKRTYAVNGAADRLTISEPEKPGPAIPEIITGIMAHFS